MKYPKVWSVILRRVLQNKWVTAGMIGALIASALLELLPPALLQTFVDRHLFKAEYAGMFSTAIAYAGTLLVLQGVTAFQMLLTTWLGQGVLFDLRMSIGKHLAALPISYFNQRAAGEIMSRATSDVEAVNTMFTTGILNMAGDLFRIFGMVTAMMLLHVKLTIATLCVAPLVMIASWFFTTRIRGAERLSRSTTGIVTARILETITGIRVVKAFAKEEFSMQNLDNGLNHLLKARRKSAWYISGFLPVTDFLRSLLTVIIFILGFMSLTGTDLLTAGTLVAFINLGTRLFMPLFELSNRVQSFQQALAGMERIEELLGTPAEDRPPRKSLPEKIEGRLEIQNLCYEYLPGKPVLRDVSLTIEPCERVVVAGRSGAGKSTLINLIGGLYPPQSGRILIDGIDPRVVPPTERRRLLGIVPQQVQLFEGNLRENIRLGDPSISDTMIEEVLETSGLGDFFTTLPDGLNTLLREGGSNLSFGERQLLSLSRALVANPRVLLLDEPSSGLDGLSEQKLLAAIRDESNRRTVITVSHRFAGVMDGKRIIVMQDGVVAQDGPPELLEQQEGWYRMIRTLEGLGWNG